MQHNKLQTKKSVKIYSHIFLLTSFVVMSVITGCLNFGKADNGVTFVSQRGSRPPAQGIVWSPTDENKILVTAYATPIEPAEVFILNIQTGQKDILAKQLPALFFEAKWTPDGKHALILSGGDTVGFEVPGWWKLDVNNKSSEHILDMMDAAWSPNGMTIAALRGVKKGVNTVRIDLLLINPETDMEEIIATYDQADSSSGLSWSPDGQNLVFSLGKYGFNDLYILNIGTRQIFKITEGAGSKHPIWSPMGEVIVFEKYPSLHLISPDGDCEVEFPELDNVWSPTWSPDGMRLGYIDKDGIYFVDIAKVLGRNIYEGLCE